MYKNFKMHCPTKDETVSLTVNYISTNCLEDIGKTPSSKGRIESCTGYDDNRCNPCKLYSKLPAEI